MDKLNNKVNKIEQSLEKTSKNLETRKHNAHINIGSEMSAMRDALLRSQQSIEHVTSETSSFMLTLEDHRPSDIDLKPQMSWLSKNITSVLWEFDEAESKATKAMERTMEYQVLIGNIEQSLIVCRLELDQAQAEGDDLKSKAMLEYWDNMRLVREATESIEEKSQEISTKQWEASRSRTKLSEHQNKLRTMVSDLETKRRKAEKAKDKAWIGGALAVGGILAAPFTAGASLGVTAVSGSYSIKKAIDYDDLKDAITATRNTISTLEDEVRRIDSQVSSLNAQKASMERHLRQLERSMSQHQAAKESSEKDIVHADSISRDITGLVDQASMATTEAHHSMHGLQELKQTLNEVAASLSSQSATLEIQTSTLDQRLIQRTQQARQFKREKEAIVKATEALTVAQTRLPALLEGSKMKLLELRPAKGDVYISSIFQEDIPELKLRPRPVVRAEVAEQKISVGKVEVVRKNEAVVTVSVPGAFPDD